VKLGSLSGKKPRLGIREKLFPERSRAEHNLTFFHEGVARATLARCPLPRQPALGREIINNLKKLSPSWRFMRRLRRFVNPKFEPEVREKIRDELITILDRSMAVRTKRIALLSMRKAQSSK